ncbi:uncharacterized protein A1O5_09107 [Cladophialophora psammophila CBS 110553]|uniref:Transglycosylase SLT domain-containing protein n=1 Tax=Cladophialophora psammophila CBS 110553 TaxID=1182543 RepID=W9WSX8_9EURO|nr:uncharacterized protein A1O5_09107 [Cladophialophora psammophila CBS 110553]EXJ67761.1 hypothetical protein A1O5_09107 [Cladophialophora psammophila CBS 110553]
MYLTLLCAASLLGIVSPAPLSAPASNQVFALGAANHPTDINDGAGAGSDIYRTYSGDGSASAGWPEMAQWVSFEDMFNANKNFMRVSCVNLGSDNGPDNSDEEIDQIWDAVQSASSQTNVDHRFILAILLQESNGCVRVRTTDNGVPNPGLMQAHNGGFSCNTNGNIQTPCPASEITGMVLDGTAGTLTGDGLAGILNQGAGKDAKAYYRTARQYNTGSIAESGNLDEGGYSTSCYASDIANRLTGWVWAVSNCAL